MTDETATRDAYGSALLELGKKNKKVVALDADLGDSTRSLKFGEEFPERYFSMGIAEQDMMGAAAGLSVSGKIAYASTFAIFTERAFDFVRNIISRNNLNVKIAGSHVGIGVGMDGKSAQAIEDTSIYRTLPNMVILEPADAVETEKMVFGLADYEGSSYMRLNRNKVPNIHDKHYKFKIGKGEIIRPGKDATIFACGLPLHESLKAAEILKGKIDVCVINMSSIKPIDDKLIIDQAKKTPHIFTAEDHNIIGGLGSAVAEVITSNYPTFVHRIGVNDQYAESGSPKELYEKYGLSAEKIAERIKSVVK